ncbi:MAG: helix-turn-helix transcriptional regulator [Oscillospiraceae bacterium]|nr:helix-turn-helix transcriptional regulator [Oscillospiraceae bacterium]
MDMKISLRAARVNAGLTQRQVTEKTGFARSTLVRWESGRGFPRIDDLTVLCTLYGVDVKVINR